jgi:serine/threonine protein kinase
VRFQCTHCRGILAIDECEPGEAVACGHCGTAVAVPETRLSPGAIVGDFIVRERLGEGGMGTVYLTHQISLDRVAAVKVLHGRYASDEAYIRDFIREARAAAAINHPSIVQAYAVGEDEHLFYFAMEYVPGSTLKQVLVHGGRLVAERVLDIGLQVAGALDFAWRSQGLVHRDIKPDNIILTADGAVKLADLGLARKLSEVASDGTQELYGTPQYIAPEHLLGSRGDNRGDIYSLGATLFHALTGRFPYEGSSAADIAHKHLTEPLAPIRSLCPEVPARLAQVVETMLAKRPQDRYPDAASLLADFEVVRQDGEPAYAPSANSQAPIDFDSEEAVAIGAGRDLVAPPTGGEAPEHDEAPRSGKRRFSVSKTLASAAAHRQGSAPTVAADSLGETEAYELGGDRDTGEAAERRPGRRWALLAVAVLVVLGGAGVAYYFRVVRPGAGAGADGRGFAGRDGGASQPGGPVAAALEGLRQDIARGRPATEVRTRLAAVLAEHGYDHGDADAMVALAAPYLEQDLESARRPVYETERQQWEDGWNEAKTKAATAVQKAEEEAEAEKQRQRAEEEAKRLAAENARREAARAEQKRAARGQAAELCRTHQFDDANRLFVPLTTARDADLARWAGARQAMLALAKQLFESIVNSKEQLAGLKLDVPAQPKIDWRVSRIGFRDVELQNRRVTYNKGQRDEQTESLEIPFADLSPPQLDRLTERKWELDGRDEGERKLFFGAYLLAREQFLHEARKRLESCGRDDAGPLLQELAAVEPEWRRAEVDRLVEQIDLCLQQGDRRGAAARVEYLQRTFPAEAEAMKEALQEKMGGP